MDSVESFLSSFILKTLLHSYPNLSPDDQAKIQKTVADLVTSAMDVTAIYFLLRNAKNNPPK
jgi:hypothetical protein